MNEIAIADIKPISKENNERMLKTINDLIKFPPDAEKIIIPTQHLLHAGTYVRTCLIRRGLFVGSALIKIPTVLIIDGDVVATDSEHRKRYVGYNVLKGAPFRRAFWLANADTYMTMFFATQAKTLEEACKEFTDEFQYLYTAEE